MRYKRQRIHDAFSVSATLPKKSHVSYWPDFSFGLKNNKLTFDQNFLHYNLKFCHDLEILDSKTKSNMVDKMLRFVSLTNVLSSGNAFVSEAGGLRFKPWAGEIAHSVAYGSPPLRHFFERSCVARAQ